MRFGSLAELAEGLDALTFGPDDFLVLRYEQCPAHVTRPFREAVLRLVQDPDWEVGAGTDGTLAWVDEQVAAQSSNNGGGLFGIFLLVHKTLGQALACYGVVEDDRGVKAREGLDCDCLFGFFHVFAAWRKLGIFAKVMLPAVRQHCQAHASTRGKPVKVSLFTANPPAKAAYLAEGFTSLRSIPVQAFGQTFHEELMEGQYTATS